MWGHPNVASPMYVSAVRSITCPTPSLRYTWNTATECTRILEVPFIHHGSDGCYV